MVLLVPDDDVTEDASSVPEQQPKAQLDDSEASKATQKVDLDLDDAPFLEDEEEEEAIAETEEETPMVDDEGDEGPGLGRFLALLKNKFFLISAGIILILLVVIVILLLREPEAPPPPPPPPPAQEQPQASVTEATPEILISLDPFLVEQRDENGEIRFLEVRILLSTEEEGLAKQFKQETYTVRNALFYYLKNKDLQFLSDKENSDKLKQELLAIVNQYMGFGQFTTLMFDQYLVR